MTIEELYKEIEERGLHLASTAEDVFVDEIHAKYGKSKESIRKQIALLNKIPEEKKPYKPEVDKVEKVTEEKGVGILDLFDPGELTAAGSGTYKCACWDCGLQGNRTEGFIIFPDSNTAFCHSSGKWFKMLEAFAMKNKIIRCLDGREPGDSQQKILAGELFTLTLEELKNQHGTEMYNRIIESLNIRRKIQLPGNGRYITTFCDELGDVYRTRNVMFYRRETQDVTEVVRTKKINDDDVEEFERGFKAMTAGKLVSLVEMFTMPWTFNMKGQEVMKSMNVAQAALALESPNFYNKLPVLARMFDIQIPILYKGKLTFPKRGYDKRFGSWLPYNAPHINEKMFTISEARAIIDKIFEEFCFAGEKDKTHAIAAFITPFLRGLFPEFCTRTPVFIYMANRERAGKDYCANCTGILYEGIATEEPPISNDEKGGNGNSNEEIRKKITSCMMQGKKRFHSSNNKGLLNNSVFESITTSKSWSDRVLGKNINVIYANEMDFSLSGNLGIRLTPDLANRARIINLHLVDEDANARTFKNPKLHEWIINNRVIIISALYRIVENWFEKGMPKGSVPFTSFPIWAEICGGIMEAAGYNNPCLKDDVQIVSLDGDTDEMKLLFECCYAKHGNNWIMKKDIQDVVSQEGMMPELDFSRQTDKIKFAIKIDKYINRILSGISMTIKSKDVRPDRREYLFTMKNEPNILNAPIKYDRLVGMEGLVGLSSRVYKKDILRSTSPENPTKPYQPYQDLKPLDKTEPKDLKSNDDSQLDLNTTGLKSEEVFKPDALKSDLSSDVHVENLKGFKKDENLSKITLEEWGKKGDEYLKKEAEKKFKPKEKTNRELQYWEAPECAGIVKQCTKEQTLKWIKDNPEESYIKMYRELGNGCFVYVGELLDEAKIKPKDDGWRSIDV